MTDDVIDDETRPESAGAVGQFPDGIYLHMDEDVYHAQERFSNSHAANILVSEGDFWARSWMNPNREEKVTDAQRIGRAFHTARLEPEKLNDRFVRQIDAGDFPDGCLMNDTEVKAAIKDMLPKPEDHPDVLIKDTEVKDALGELGLPKTGTVEDRKDRLREASAGVVFWSDIIAEWEAKHGPTTGPDGEDAQARAERLRSYGYEGAIWCLEAAKFEAERGDRVTLGRKEWAQITADIEAMKSSPIAGRFLTGGLPEVTLLWTHESGVSMKARIDYLRPDLFVDVKTFDNPRKKHYKECIFDATRYNGYYRQFRFYYDACEAMRLNHDLQIMDSEDQTAHEVIRAIRDRAAPLGAAAVFQQKGGVPNIYGCPVKIRKAHISLDAASTGNASVDAPIAEQYAEWSLFGLKAKGEIDEAIMLFMRCMKVYGEGQPWRPLEPIFDIDDNSFNGFWLDPDYQTEDITV